MKHPHLLLIALAFLLVLFSACGVVHEEGDLPAEDVNMTKVRFDAAENPPDCMNADLMERSFDEVYCRWDCAEYKGAAGRRVEITFKPLGNYTDKEIQTWHVADEYVTESYEFHCPERAH